MSHAYHGAVRVGNWYEDACLEEDKMKDFLHKRDKNELLGQKGFDVSQHFLAKVELSSSSGGVNFGEKVCLYNGPHSHIRHMETSKPSILAASMSPNDLLGANALSASSALASAATDLTPNARTVFLLLSAQGKPSGSPLLYGEHFVLCTTQQYSKDYTLKLHSGAATLHSDKKNNRSRHQNVDFSADFDSYCRWTALCHDPQYRLETEFTEVKANQPVVIKHMNSGKNLAAETYQFRSMFGTDYEVSAHNYLNAHKAESPANLWMFAMKGAGDFLTNLTARQEQRNSIDEKHREECIHEPPADEQREGSGEQRQDNTEYDEAANNN